MPVHGTRDIYPPYPREQPVFHFRTKQYERDYELISDFETIGDWTLIAGDSINVDTDHFKEGSQGVRWRSVNNVTTIAERTISLDCLGKHFELWVYVDDTDNLGALEVDFEVTAPWAKYWHISISLPLEKPDSGWNKIGVPRNGWFSVGGAVKADWANIIKVRMLVRSTVGTTVNVTFDDFRMVRDRFAGKITLRFDDDRTTVFDEARPRMDEYGFRGVAAVPTSYPISGDPLLMTLDQITLIQERGWDIISHAVTHTDLTTLTPAEVENQLWNSQRWLIEHGFYKGSRFFVPPGHSYNLQVLEQIKKYYLGCQTKLGWGAIPPADQYRMLSRTGDDVGDTTGYIDDVVANGGWLTLLFHGVGELGYISPADFQTVIDYIATSGLEVVTLSDVFDDLLVGKSYYPQLLEFGVQGAITAGATSYPCPGGGVAAQTATEIKIPISRSGWLKNLRVRQRVASGGAGLTDIYTVRVNGADTDLTGTLDNATVGSDLVHSAYVEEGDEVSVKLVSNNVADVSADISVTVELELLM